MSTLRKASISLSSHFSLILNILNLLTERNRALPYIAQVNSSNSSMRHVGTLQDVPRFLNTATYIGILSSIFSGLVCPFPLNALV